MERTLRLAILEQDPSAQSHHPGASTHKRAALPAPCPSNATLEKHAQYLLTVLAWCRRSGFRETRPSTLWSRVRIRALIARHALAGSAGLSQIFDSLLVQTRVGRRAIWLSFKTGRMP